ncbi:hypothetical protein H0O03_04335 [Candidatus Micrarchaeota archaeon]|nr:hypothetical protein [Candidatus Micrarchaeota archaeon]
MESLEPDEEAALLKKLPRTGHVIYLGDLVGKAKLDKWVREQKLAFIKEHAGKMGLSEELLRRLDLVKRGYFIETLPQAAQKSMLEERVAEGIRRFRALRTLSSADILAGNKEVHATQLGYPVDRQYKKLETDSVRFHWRPTSRETENLFVLAVPSGNYGKMRVVLNRLKKEARRAQAEGKAVVLLTHHNPFFGPFGMALKPRQIKGVAVRLISEDDLGRAKFLRQLAREMRADYIFCGHRHEPLFGKMIGVLPQEQHSFKWFTKMGGERKEVPVIYLQEGLVARVSDERRPRIELF